MDPTILVSGLGVVVAVMTLVYTRKSALATPERSRPNVVIGEVQVGCDRRLVVTNLDSRPLDLVNVELVAEQCMSDPSRPARPLPIRQTWSADSIERFQSVQSSISTSGVPDGYEALVSVRAAQGNERWTWTTAVHHSQ